MVEFKDLTTDAGLTQLNTHLSTRSYVEGFKPSGADISAASKVGPVDAKYVHVSRWLNHIRSFPAEQRTRWTGAGAAAAAPAAKGAKSPAKSPAKAPAKKAAAADSDDEDDFKMSLDDSDDEGGDAMAAILAKKAAEAAKKKKDAPVAMSSVVIDVKPNESETDLEALNTQIRTSIAMDGLTWNKAYEKLPVAYGIFKLRMTLTVEDEKVSTDDIQEAIEAFEDVQSTDIVAFNKI